jgi:hypothetical protein
MPLCKHANRYQVARHDVATAWLGDYWKGERLSAALVVGLDDLKDSDFHEARRYVVDLEFDRVKRVNHGVSIKPMVSPRLRKAANRMRVMAQHYTRPADKQWRTAIARAVAYTIMTAAEPPTNSFETGVLVNLIMDEAASVGEAEWAERELLPLLALRTPVLTEERDLMIGIASLIVNVGWATKIREWLGI